MRQGSDPRVSHGAYELKLVGVSHAWRSRSRDVSSIRSAKELEGQTVAVGTLVSLTSVSLRMWLAQNGADPAKVQFIEMKFGEMPAALERGTVAAAYLV